MLSEQLSALNTGTAEAVAAFYAADAVLEDFIQTPPVVTEGRERIAEVIGTLKANGLRYHQAGTPIMIEGHVVMPMKYSNAYDEGASAEGVRVFEINEEGKIVREWMTGLLDRAAEPFRGLH